MPPTPRPATPPTTPSPQPAPKASLPEGTTYFVHTVKYPGETVSIIAAWYLGDKMRFDVLGAANPEIKDLARITAGMKINIPENMAKTREPMTKEFVDGFYKRSPAPSTGPSKQEEPVPIGPK